MSHYLALVFVRPEVADAGAAALLAEVGGLLSPYDATRHDASGGPNRHARWDGWDITGRWRAALALDAADAPDAVPDVGSLLVGKLPYDEVPFAIVTPDGVWHDEGTMGWFGFATNLDPYWEDKYDRFRERYADHLAIGVDCHI